MLLTFFDARGIIHREFLPPDVTVNAAYYKDVMDRLLKRIRRVRPNFIQGTDFSFTIMNRVIMQLSCKLFWRQNLRVIKHPLYSPDLAPADFFLFPKFKLDLKGTCFENIEEIQATTTILNSIPENDFSRAFQRLYEYCKLCIECGGLYVEN